MIYDNPYRRSSMPDMLEALRAQYGEEQGTAVFADACGLLNTYLVSIDTKTDKAVVQHLSMGILPAGACYLSLRGIGVAEGEALRFVSERVAAHTEKTAGQMRRLCGRMPFAVFRLVVRALIATGFPSSGWKTRWTKNTSTGIAFEMRSCLYLDTLTGLGCPELCAAFCDADHIMLGVLAPRILFSREGTLAGGSACCDFAFAKGDVK